LRHRIGTAASKGTLITAPTLGAISGRAREGARHPLLVAGPRRPVSSNQQPKQVFENLQLPFSVAGSEFFSLLRN